MRRGTTRGERRRQLEQLAAEGDESARQDLFTEFGFCPSTGRGNQDAGDSPHEVFDTRVKAGGGASANGWVRVAASLRDDGIAVLLALFDGEVWTGYLDGGTWRYASDDVIEGVAVTHWMDFPEPPHA